MKLIDRIQLFFMLRRADNANRNFEHAKASPVSVSRPHVQSDHLISYPVPKERLPRDPDYGVGPVYVVVIIGIVALVYYVNTHYAPPTSISACMQLASK